MNIRKRYLLIPPLFLLFVFLFYDTYREVRAKTIEDFNKQQMAVARQAAIGIQSLFGLYQSELSFLAAQEDIIGFNVKGTRLMAQFLAQNAHDLSGVTRVDANGTILHTEPRNAAAIGQNIRYQDHMARILRHHQPVISDVFSTVQGFRSIALHVPIHDKDQFVGTIAVLIPFEAIARRFLENIRMADNGYAWMISQKGVVLYCPVPGHTGRSVLEIFEGFPDTLKMVEHMMAGRSGTAVYTFHRKTKASLKPIRKQAAYVAVPLGDTHWSVVVATPENEVLNNMQGFRDKFFVLLTAFVLVSVVLTAFLLRAVAMVRAERQRARLTQALEASERRFRQIIEQSPVAMGISRIEGQVTYLNPKFKEMLGYDLADFGEAATAYDIAWPDMTSCDDSLRDWAKTLKSPSSPFRNFHLHDVQMTCKDGSVRHVDIQSSRVGEQWLTLFTDITERVESQRKQRELEEQLHRSKKMEALGVLAGGVAHDLNNILSGFVTYPDLVLMELPEESPLRQPMITIQKTGERASAVVADLLTLARGIASQKVPLNLNVVISEYLCSEESFGLWREHASVQHTQSLHSQAIWIDGSEVHIRKACMNLVTNAFEAVGDRGWVDIRTQSIHLTRGFEGYEHIPAGRYGVLTVENNGPPIDESDMERIFEPFYTKKIMGRSGSGLGLAVVWNTIKDHEGFVHLESDPSHTQFSLYFPLARTSNVPQESGGIPLEALKGNGERILVVDDEPSQREIAAIFLERMAYQVSTAASGEQAIESIQQQPVDLVILDMIMGPGLNGKETYLHMLKTQPELKTILVSGFAESEETQAALEAGCGLFLKKPYTLADMARSIRSLLES